MKLLSILPLALLVVGCGQTGDPLAGRWDVADPQSAAKASVTVGEFRNGKMTLERRGEVLGIGKVAVTTTGTYELSGDQVFLTHTDVKVDASAISNPKVRAETIRIMEGAAKAEQGQRRDYSLRAESPDKIVLSRPQGSLTLTRAR